VWKIAIWEDVKVANLSLTKVANSKPTNVPCVMKVGSIRDQNGAFT